MAVAQSYLDQALAALADGNHRAILPVVRSGPRAVGQIAERTGLSQQATTYYLGVLRSAGLVSGTRSGTQHPFAGEHRRVGGGALVPGRVLAGQADGVEGRRRGQVGRRCWLSTRRRSRSTPSLRLSSSTW